MAKKISVDGTEMILPDSKLETLQAAVGGFIELVHLPGGGYVVVNEEGLCLNLPVNKKATAIVACCFPAFDGIIVGNAVLCEESEIK